MNILNTILKKKRPNNTYLDIMSEMVDRGECDIDDIVDIVKANKTIFQALYQECRNRGLLKEKRLSNNVMDIFNDN